LEKPENGICTAAVDDDDDDDDDDDEKSSVSQGFVEQIMSLRHSDFITYNES
jgi:hypothetical protein